MSVVNDSIDDCDEVSRNADQTPLLVLRVVLLHKNEGTERETLAGSPPPTICLPGSPFVGSKPFRELEAERP